LWITLLLGPFIVDAGPATASSEPVAAGTVSEVPLGYIQRAEAILAAWRQAERGRAAAQPGSPEAKRNASQMAQLKADYKRIIGQAAAVLPRHRKSSG